MWQKSAGSAQREASSPARPCERTSTEGDGKADRDQTYVGRPVGGTEALEG